MKAKINNYLSTKNIRRRRRIDELMIMIAVVGIAGTILVFNSYASRKIDTQNTGEYSFIKLLAQSGSNYTNIAKIKSASNEDIYALKKSSSISTPFILPANKFCIYGWNREGASMKVGFSNIPTGLPKTEGSLVGDYALNNTNSKVLECYDTSKYPGTKGDLVISSDGNVWIEKVVTQ